MQVFLEQTMGRHVWNINLTSNVGTSILTQFDKLSCTCIIHASIIYTYLFINLSYLSIYLSNYLSIYLSYHLSLYAYLSIITILPIYLFIYSSYLRSNLQIDFPSLSMVPGLAEALRQHAVGIAQGAALIMGRVGRGEAVALR